MLAAIRDATEPVRIAHLAKLAGIKAADAGKLIADAEGVFNWGTDKTPSYWHTSPVAVARERLLAAAAHGLFTPAQLLKKAVPGIPKVKPADVQAAYTALVNEGTPHFVAEKTREEAKLSMLAAIREARQPATLAELAGPVGLKPADAKKLLSEMEGIFSWGAAWWHKSSIDVARERVLEAAAEVPTEAELARKAGIGKPELKPAQIKSAKESLLAEKLLYRIGKRIMDPPHAQDWLETEIAGILKAAHWDRPAAQIRALLSGAPPAQLPQSTDTVEDTAEKIFTAMNRIAFSPGATVTFYRLRQQPELAGIPKKIFDEAALLLQKERKALLAVHDHASALAPEEREKFVTDGLGTYYVSIYSR